MRHAAILTIVALTALALVGCKGETADSGSGDDGKVALYLPGQEKCPVSGDPIDKDYHRDVGGKRIYFCCESCPKAFDKEPDKFLAVLDRRAEEMHGHDHGDHAGHDH